MNVTYILHSGRCSSFIKGVETMVTITLPPELEKVVVEKAEQLGTTPELYILDDLRLRFMSVEPLETPVVEGESMAEFLGDFIGCLDSGELVPGGAKMSEDIGEKFAQGMIEKRKRGRL